MSSLDDPKFATGTNYAAGPHAGNANKARPGAGIITEGFDPGAGIPTEWLNYLNWLHGTWLASLRDGTVSLSSMTVDGTGGVIGSPVAGTAVVSGNIQGATITPTASTGAGAVAATLYKDLVPWAWAKMGWTGSAYVMNSSAGLDMTYNSNTGFAKLATGIVDFRLLNTVPGGDNGTLVMATSAGAVLSIPQGGTGSGNPKVFVFNTSGSAIDAGFDMLIFAK